MSWTLFENNQDCVKEIMGTMYWEALGKIELIGDDGSYLNLALLIFGIMVISGIVIGLSIYVGEKKEKLLN